MNKKGESKYIFTIYHFTFVVKTFTYFFLSVSRENCGRPGRSIDQPLVLGNSQSPELHFHAIYL